MTTTHTAEQTTAATETGRLIWELMGSRTRRARDEAIDERADRSDGDLPGPRATTFWALTAGDLLENLENDWMVRQNASDYHVHRVIAMIFRDAANTAVARQRADGHRPDRDLTNAIKRAEQALANSTEGTYTQRDNGPPDLLAQCWRETMDDQTRDAYAEMLRTGAVEQRATYRHAHGAVLRILADQTRNPHVHLIADACMESAAADYDQMARQRRETNRDEHMRDIMRLVPRQAFELANQASQAVREAEILLALENRDIDDMTERQASEAAAAVGRLWAALAAQMPEDETLAARALQGQGDADMVTTPEALRQRGVRATAAALTDQVGLAAAQWGNVIRASGAAAVHSARRDPRPADAGA